MNQLDQYRRLFDYDQWANQRLLDVLDQTAGQPESARRYFSHLLAAGWNWQARILQHRSGAAREICPLFDLYELERCRRLVGELGTAWTQLFDELSESELDQQINYVSMNNQPFSNRLADLFNHVVNHASYHRGQAAAAIRALGITPPMTDFILFVRERS